MTRAMSRAALCLCVVLGLQAHPLRALVRPQSAAAQEKAFRHPDLAIREYQQTLDDLDPSLAASARGDLAFFGISADPAFFDSRVGRWSSLILREPMIPGSGEGNALRWTAGVRASDSAIQDQAWAGVSAYLTRHQAQLRLDSAEFGAPRVTVLESGSLVYVYVPRVVGGIAVRNSSISATLNHGNLILLGLQNWGDVQSAQSPNLSPEQARAAVGSHAAPFTAKFGRLPYLELLPMARDSEIYYRLVWVVDARLDGDIGNWEGLVDAHTGELMSFQDKNDYAQRTISGGVYPVSNDQRPPDGIEQPGYPMPFADIHIGSGTVYTDQGGNIGCATGTISTNLSGLFLKMNDTCGAINETSSGSLALGSGPTAAATNCTVPAGAHSAGDTKASRTGYFELNQLILQAKGWIPANTWLQSQLTANMNLNMTCNAFWDGSAVNFFKSGGGCANTGEEAAIFDHEWGHGLDDNDSNGIVSSPGEAIADMHAAMRLKTSCIGRGFFPGGVCGGYGDKCDGTPATGCTGVRDIDFANHACNLPHGISWITSGFTSGQCAPGRPPCPADADAGPCGREVHCEGQIVAEAGWDLATRDLTDDPFNYDSNTALEITTRLFYLGAQPVINWYACSVGGGCGATGGYLSLLAADDDDGNLGNGTPHMTAIRAAFERHQIHCATPAPLNSGCAGGPTTAATVTAIPQDASVVVSWNAVAGASSYLVYRTDGVHACDFGKIKVGTTSDLTFTDTGLQNGRTYYYGVIAVGGNNACMGPMSECVTAVPLAGLNLGLQPDTSLEISNGDGDAFLDNCETGTITFTVANTGTGALTNVRLLSVNPLTHPTTEVLTTLPASIATSLDECATAQSSFSFIPRGMSFGDTTELEVVLAADGLPGGTRSQIISIANVETDAVPVATRTYSFENTLQGWTIASGTYSLATPGANGTGFHLSSSSNVDDACDVIDSPALQLGPASTLSLYDRYTTENPTPTPFDRANVGIRDLKTHARTTIVPSGGRLYDLPPGSPNGSCVTNRQGGWAGTKSTFAVSNWSPAALNPGGAFTGKLVAIEVAYGTDDLVSLAGLDFDEVTITNFFDLGPDTQPNSCVAQSVGPVTIAVNPAGNGVLDPNVSTVLRPTWQNTGFAAITLTGTLTSFTGPGDGAGVTYGIPDAAADYGTVAAANQATCGADPGCYSLQITTPARPVQHWDATVLETTTPTATAKMWTLHVGGSFADVSTNIGTDPYYPSIETIFHNGVTVGCHGGTAFCPNDPNLRSEMAVFLLKASQGAGYTPPACTGQFTDVPCPATAGFPFSDFIEELSTRGITAGCGSQPGPPPTQQYCPDRAVLRSEMAVFLLKASQGAAYTPPPCTGKFTDVPCPATVVFPYSDFIEDIHTRGITVGCVSQPGPPPILQYCPDNSVTRQEMAVFLTRTFGLVLYGP